MAASPSRISLPGGLRLVPADRPAALRAAICCILLACLIAVVADRIALSALPASYADFYNAPLWPRTLMTSLQSMREELVYRLGLQTLLAALPLLVRRQSGAAWMIGAIILAQLANAGHWAFAVPPWGMVRFWLVGCIWGWLYWRHGFVTALLAHGASHLLLDPLLLAII
ncbi:MAG: type II CAAX prenyl endopeptidase Rce1 family protein [Novosphingobium sp.]